MVINEKTLSLDVKVYNQFFLRLRGLMFRRKPLRSNEGILLVPCNSIHMFFMFFPIDAVFLDKQNTILHIASQIKPFQFVRPVKHAHAVLEVPSGFAKKNNLEKGMTILFTKHYL